MPEAVASAMTYMIKRMSFARMGHAGQHPRQGALKNLAGFILQANGSEGRN